MSKIIKSLVIIMGLCWAWPLVATAEFRPYWDFRQWGMAARTPKPKIYADYMDKFAQQGINVLILLNNKSLPPFKMERQFLEDAKRRGVNVWLRTNRVSPKGGIPGLPHSTLDFALNEDMQKQTLDYLLALAALSKEYANFTGLIIGGEEWVGAYVDKEALERYNAVAQKQLGFPITGPLTEAQKIRYFDWMQQIQNDWYGKIWDTVKTRYPDLELFIYPSTIAVCGDRWSSFPRPAYWDVHDLIVSRKKHFSIMSSACTLADPLGSDQTAAFGAYWRAATEGEVPYYLLLQVNRDGPRTPTPQDLNRDVLAAIESGTRGVGYWPVDMDTKKDIYETDPARWKAVFQAIAQGSQYRPAPKESGLYVVKPRYSQYWQKDDFQTLRTLAALRRAGLAPQFLLAEQVLAEPLPSQAKIYYLPETFKYESTRVWERLLESGKPMFFGEGPAEPGAPGREPLTPLYSRLGLKKIGASGEFEKGVIPALSGLKKFLPGGSVPREITVSWGGTLYRLALFPPPQAVYKSGEAKVATVAFQAGVDARIEKVPLVFSDGRMIFLAASDYGLLMSAAENNQNSQFMKALLLMGAEKRLIPPPPNPPPHRGRGDKD